MRSCGISLTTCCVISQKSADRILQLFYAYGPVEPGGAVHSTSEMRTCLKVYSFPGVIVWKFCSLNSKYSWTVCGIWHSYWPKLQLSRREWSRSFPLSGYKTFLRSVLVCPTYKHIILSGIYRYRVFKKLLNLGRYFDVHVCFKGAFG